MDRLLTHQSTRESLLRILNSPTHAIGLEGGSGSGKKYLSKYIANELLKVKNIESYPYAKIINADDKTGIEEIREAIKFLALKIPGDQTYKRCLIFWSFEKLGHAAQNAFLKSLEEAPTDTLIILTTESKNNLLPTIASRMTWLSILPVSLENAMDYFKEGSNEALIKKAYALSSGRPGILNSLINGYEEHPLSKSIASIKALLQLDRFERMAEINKLTKDKELDINMYLMSLAKVLEASMKKRLDDSGQVDRKTLDDLKKVLKTLKFQKYNTNQKLLLTDIFYNL